MRNKRMGVAGRGLTVLLLAAVALSGGVAARADAGEREDLRNEVKALYEKTSDFQKLFQKSIQLVMPSVVSISTTRTITRRMPTGDMFIQPFDPFGRSPLPQQRQPKPREFKTNGLGSGFVARADGYIVTNFHVVDGVRAEDIKVIFADGKEYTAEGVMRDENTEVAVVKINAKGLQPLTWADSQNVNVGEWVIAIGSPLGLGNTVTTGIVSATSTRDRVIAEGERHDLSIIRQRTGYAIEDYIQTDAAINPGNSGGPLITLNGLVLGINTLIVSPTRSSAGLGFAVPEKIARTVVDQLIDKGRVVRGHLGVQIMDLGNLTDEAAMQGFEMHNADEVRRMYHILKNDKGVLVAGVMPEGPAARGGIEMGDLILSVDGAAIEDVPTLQGVIRKSQPGAKVDVAIQRKGRKQTLTVTLGEQPASQSAVAAAGKTQTLGELGLTVQTLTPQVAEGLGYSADLRGIVVTDVAANSPAATAGLEVNDIHPRRQPEARGQCGGTGAGHRRRRARKRVAPRAARQDESLCAAPAAQVRRLLPIESTRVDPTARRSPPTRLRRVVMERPWGTRLSQAVLSANKCSSYACGQAGGSARSTARQSRVRNARSPRISLQPLRPGRATAPQHENPSAPADHEGGLAGRRPCPP